MNRNSKNNKKGTWNDSYKINIPYIDNQHRTFFEIYDELLSSRDSGEPHEKIRIAISRLFDYALNHFRAEESLMKVAEFQGLESHAKHHRFFESKMNEFQLASNYNNPYLIPQVLVFIRKWFLSHIAQTDYLFKNDVAQFLTNEGA